MNNSWNLDFVIWNFKKVMVNPHFACLYKANEINPSRKRITSCTDTSEKLVTRNSQLKYNEVDQTIRHTRVYLAYNGE